MRYALGTIVFAVSISIATAACAFQEPTPSPKPFPSDKIPKCRSRYGEKHLQELKKNLPGMISDLEKIKRQARRLGRYLEDLERNIKTHPDVDALKKQKSDTEKEFEEVERQRFEKEHEIERAQAKIKELEGMDPCELPEPSPSPSPPPKQ